MLTSEKRFSTQTLLSSPTSGYSYFILFFHLDDKAIVKVRITKFPATFRFKNGFNFLVSGAVTVKKAFPEKLWIDVSLQRKVGFIWIPLPCPGWYFDYLNIESYFCPCETFTMKLFAKIVNSRKLLLTFAKMLIIDV